MEQRPTTNTPRPIVSKWRLALINLGVFLGLLLILGAALEVGTRIFVWFKYGRVDHGMYWIFRYEPYLLVRTDDQLHRKYPPKGEKFRVLLLGGSTARNLPEDVLGGALHRFSDRQVEVINLGQGGYIVDQELIVLGRYGVKLRPDLLITLDGANDIVNLTKTWRPGIHYTSTFVELAMDHPFRNLFFGLLRSSQFVNSIHKLHERRLEEGVQGRGDLLDQNQRHYLETLESISTFTRGLGIWHVAVLQPYLHLRANPIEQEMRLATNYDYRKEFMIRTYRSLRDGLRDHQFGDDVLVIDATGAFDETVAECFEDEVHLTPTGNRVLSELIARRIRESGLLEARTRHHSTQPPVRSNYSPVRK